MKYKFIYYGIGHGSIVSDKAVDEKFRSNEFRFFLDVGNYLGDGVFDHHQKDVKMQSELLENSFDFDPVSATALLVKHKNIIDEKLAIIENIAFETGLEEITIEIATHIEPDLDCFASAYLLQEYIEHRQFPKGEKNNNLISNLVKYVNEVDSGRLNTTIKNINSMVAASYTLPYIMWAKAVNIISAEHIANLQETPCVLEEIKHKLLADEKEAAQLKKRKPAWKEKVAHENIMARGVELVNYCVELIKKSQDDTLNFFSENLLPQSNPFEWELAFAAQDYYWYEKDIKNTQLCHIHQVELPLKDDNTKTALVDALFWNDIPTCILHKHWARQDTVHSTLRKGFTMTFIPCPARHNEFLDEIIICQRVIISTDPNREVNLKGLCKIIEEAELSKETARFDETSLNNWRPRYPRRFTDNWCKTSDPWYDGRGTHDYTIIDAPSRGSLLTIAEIKSITMSFLKPVVSRHNLRYVFPFSFDAEKYSQIGCNNEQWQKCPAEEGGCAVGGKTPQRQKYFINYICDYLYCATKKNNKQTYVKYRYLTEDTSCCQKNFTNQPPLSNLNVTLTNACLMAFCYGAGFVTVDYELKVNYDENKTEIEFDDLLFFNAAQYEDFLKHSPVNSQSEEIPNLLKPVWNILKKILNCIDSKQPGAKTLNFDQCLIFACADIISEPHYRAKKRDMSFRLCNFLEPNKPVYQPIDVDSFFERNTYLEMNDSLYNFTKKGGSLILCSNLGESEKEKTQATELLDCHNTIDFDIFLYTLHQRYCLIEFARKLAILDNSEDYGEIFQLRRTFLNFMAQSCFSQITTDELGMEKNRRWQAIFEKDVLYQEVDGQLKEISEYNSEQTRRKFESISLFLIPLIIGSSIFGMNIFEYDKNNDIFNDLSTVKSLVIWGITFLAWILFFFRKNFIRQTKRLVKIKRRR